MFPMGMQHTIPIRAGAKLLYLLTALSCPCSSSPYNEIMLKRSSDLVLCLQLISPKTAVDDSEDTMCHAQVFIIVFTQQNIHS